VRAWLQAARRIAVLTGAGMSAESGVPTFRDAQTGYWARYRPEDMATEAGYRAQPGLVWRWYAHRRALLCGVAPNAGHLALAHFAQRHPGRLALITQNVDGLHQQAGSPDVLCLHGDLRADRWLDPPRPCCHRRMPPSASRRTAAAAATCCAPAWSGSAKPCRWPCWRRRSRPRAPAT